MIIKTTKTTITCYGKTKAYYGLTLRNAKSLERTAKTLDADATMNYEKGAEVEIKEVEENAE